MTSFTGATYKVVWVEDERYIKDARRIVHFETSNMYSAYEWILEKEVQMAVESSHSGGDYWGHWEFDVYLVSSIHSVHIKEAV